MDKNAERAETIEGRIFSIACKWNEKIAPWDSEGIWVIIKQALDEVRIAGIQEGYAHAMKKQGETVVVDFVSIAKELDK